MCVGKTNRKNPRSNQDLARFAGAQADTHRQLIAPQEMAEIEQLMDKDYQAARGSILEGRANADAAAAEYQTQNTLRRNMTGRGEGTFTGGGLASGDVTSASQNSRTKGVLLGHQTGQAMTMGDRVGALRTGQGHTRGVTSGLASAARSELVAQEADAASEMAMGTAYGDAIATAAMGGYTAIKRAGDPDVSKDDLSLLGKGLRGLGMGQPSQQGFYQPQPTTASQIWQPAPTGRGTDPNNLPGSQNRPQYNYQQSAPKTTATNNKYKSFKNWVF